MYKLRSSDKRGTTKNSWLNSKHTFSFADYYDINNMGFSDLRVINDDIVAPGQGFGLHPHSNMEIISIVLEGALEHKDSIGNVSVIKKGEVQKMSAGTGILHSEYNPSKVNPVHFLQIWIIPDKMNLKPYYEQKTFDLEKYSDELILIASQNGGKNSIKISQNVKVYQCLLNNNNTVEFTVKPNRKYWVQIAEGSADINTINLNEGDGLAFSQEDDLLRITSQKDNTNFLIFDLRP